MNIRQFRRLTDDLPDSTEMVAISAETWTELQIRGLMVSNTGVVTLRLVEAEALVPNGERL